MRRLFGLIIVILLYCYIAGGVPVFAEGEFTSAYNLTYEVFESGNTRVTYNVGLTNQMTNFYAAEYTLTLATTKVQNILAFDKKGKLQTSIDKKEGQTIIHLVFNDKVVGKDQTLNFTLFYETDEIAKKNGRVWEVNIPKRGEDPSIFDYTVTLKVPKNFPPAAYFLPAPATPFTWKKDQLTGGVRAAFGDFQVFNFELTYDLANPNFYPVYMEVALPPDTPYQKISLSQVSPPPVNVRVDKDGNWLARFNLSPGQKLTVIVQGLAQIFLQSQKSYPLTSDDLKPYLVSQKYWEADDPQIKDLAKKLKTPKEIYNFVVSTLSYDYEKARRGGKRLGAKETLKNPAASICMEFTDLFIALSRAAGIPTREIDGFAYTANPRLRPLAEELDILHTWPQYWDSQKNSWVMVDPTWGSTSQTDYFENLDFNHFAFAIKGYDSERPAPAGSYKLPPEKKNVKVNFATQDLREESRWEVNFAFPREIVAGFPFEGALTLKNTAATAKYNPTVTVYSSRLKPSTSQFMLGVLPPQGSKKISLDFKRTPWFSNFQDTLEVSVDGQTFNHSVIIKPIFLKFWPWIGGGLIGVATLVFFAFKARRLLFQRRFRQNNLHRQGRES